MVRQRIFDLGPPRAPVPAYYDALGTYGPHPQGTLYALGHREPRDTLCRLVRQCYFDMLAAGDQARAFHTAKRLHEQLTGSINQEVVQRAIHPDYEGEQVAGRHLPLWADELDAQHGMADW